jgi:transcriptional regulator CtsR
MDATYRQELLTAALEGRIREVTEYQVNIDNYQDAIQRIGDDVELQDFKACLEGLLASSILECRKAQLMLDVVTAQVNPVVN